MPAADVMPPRSPHGIDVAGEWGAVTGDLAGSLPAFAPELALCGTVVLLLLGRVVGWSGRVRPSAVAFAGSAAAVGLALWRWGEAFEAAGVRFGGLFRDDPLTAFARVLIYLAWNLTVTLTVLTGVPAPTGRAEDDDGPDFHVPLAGVALGAVLMAAADHLLMLFLAVEMASVPAYILVGFRKGTPAAGEAALKYLVFGAGAAGVMMYGASLLAGVTGTLSLPGLGERLAAADYAELPLMSPGPAGAAAAGAVFVLCGLAYKLSLVPFHFWCPDAFQGALAEVAGLLSVAPKVGAFCLLVRFGLGLCGPVGTGGAELAAAAGVGLAVAGATSMTFGNLAAFTQTDLQRLLGYSTIAQGGTIVLGVAACLVGAGRGDADLARAGLVAVLVYLVGYVFLNLGAFAAVAVFRNRTRRTDLQSLAGLGPVMPVAAGCFAVSLVGLVGLPPTAGFLGKAAVFVAAVRDPAGEPVLFAAALVGAANTVASLFYYLRPVRALFLDPAADRPAVPKAGGAERAFLVLLAAPALLLLPLFGPLGRACAAVAGATL